jgi:RimJ/RimL family protein N-acetyltransferase
MGELLDTLRTERLTLREWHVDDLDALHDTYRHDEVTRYLGSVKADATTADSEVRLARFRGLCTGLFGVWAVVPDGVDHPVGSVILLALAENDGSPSGEVEIGWHLNPSAWGNGYATEAAAPLLSRAWDAEIAQVWAIVDPRNPASMKVALRIGMTPEGRTERWFNKETEVFLATRPD